MRRFGIGKIIHFRFFSVRFLGRSWGRLGAVLERLGVVLGQSGAVLGPSWAMLGRSWGLLEGLGAILGGLGPVRGDPGRGLRGGLGMFSGCSGVFSAEKQQHRTATRR